MGKWLGASTIYHFWQRHVNGSLSRAVTEGMVAAGAVGFFSPSPVVSAPGPAPSCPTPPVGSVLSPSLPTMVAGSGAPVPPPSSHPPTSGEFHNSCSAPRVMISLVFLWPPLCKGKKHGPPGPWFSH